MLRGALLLLRGDGGGVVGGKRCWLLLWNSCLVREACLVRLLAAFGGVRRQTVDVLQWRRPATYRKLRLRKWSVRNRVLGVLFRIQVQRRYSVHRSGVLDCFMSEIDLSVLSCALLESCFVLEVSRMPC